MARPRKTIKRTAVARVRFTLIEKNLIIGYARRSGITPSAFIREKALNHRITERLTNEEAQYLRKLTGMANNINMIAKKANMGDAIMPLLDEVLDQIEKLK